ncbi:MAG: FAD-dependent oxidoreductase [Leptospiraceae bacterium]|nr:FAD-dependent oxidoreductase [Leptospiraceae bacterium]
MIDILVIGSGIIGLWVAYLASKSGLTTVVCEKTTNFGDGISGRNSGVLHSGIYYPPNSQKAKHCIQGYYKSIDFFESAEIPYLICGKLITTGIDTFSSEDEKLERLKALYENGKANGVDDMGFIEDPGKKYPYVNGKHGIYIERTGVVDVATYLKRLYFLCEQEGVVFLKKREFWDALDTNKMVLKTKGKDEYEEVHTKFVVNAGGLYCDDVVSKFGISGYEIRPNKGEYYRLTKSLPYKTLIYPLPSHSSTALGVHYTFNLADECYAGPNSNWANNKEDYTFQTARIEYYESLKNILSCYSKEDLVEGYVGLRPRLFYKGESVKDFTILNQPSNAIHLLGIESPGLTSSPSIATEVIEMVKGFSD